MLYALSKDYKKITSDESDIGYCPICKQKLIPKRGEINIHHWAHVSLIDCDQWAEQETFWHLSWKELVKREYQEVIITKNKTSHRADILGNLNTVIEIQYSNINVNEIKAREKFYINLIWVLNAQKFSNNLILFNKNDIIELLKSDVTYYDEYYNENGEIHLKRTKKSYYQENIERLIKYYFNYDCSDKIIYFRWLWPHKPYFYANAPIFLHLSDGRLLKIIYIDRHVPCYGVAIEISWDYFNYLYLSNVLKEEYKINHDNVIKDQNVFTRRNKRILDKNKENEDQNSHDLDTILDTIFEKYDPYNKKGEL